MYEQRGFEYPEEVYKSIDMLYGLIKEKVKCLDEYTFITLGLNNYGFKDIEYENFCKELHRRTGYYFNSDHIDRMDSAFYHCNYKRYYELSAQAPVIYIGKNECEYDSDIKDSNSCVEVITRSHGLSLKKRKK